jgi:hypothetical protein
MRVRVLNLFFTLLFLNIYISVFSQENIKDSTNTETLIDSLKKSGLIFGINKEKPDIVLSTDQALIYLQQRFHSKSWKDPHDPLRQAFGRLIYEAANPPFDTLKEMLSKYPYDSLSIPWNKFFIYEPLRLRIPVISKAEFNKGSDSIVKPDSGNYTMKNDSLVLSSFENNKSPDLLKPVSGFKDTTIMVIIDTLHEVNSSYSAFPFRYFNFPFQGDSIKAAVKSLLNYLSDRDSTIINFTGIGHDTIPIMLNSKAGRVMRYWLKNEFSDSVTIWIGNPSKNTIGLYLEQGVNFRRPMRQENNLKAKINVKYPDNSKLLDLQNIIIRSQYWKYHNEASFVLNQASLSNWVKGGESSISTALDITEYADYNNKKKKISSNHFLRLNFGYIATGTEGIRKNLDLLETNSKFNHKAFGKFDFSAIMLFKTQIARGLNYFKTTAGNDTSNMVSKFMNPATLTVGLGLDFKPNKTTSINFSPFSYKGTFVTDTIHIDQTQYGIAKNRKSLNEPGVSFMISNEFKPIKTVSIINRVQLFTNYIHNPQNVDVDWEMIATAKLNWFTDVRFNTHLIFDDDTRTGEQYKDGQPVLNLDGTPKKTARIQFKEMLGFALSFRF